MSVSVALDSFSERSVTLSVPAGVLGYLSATPIPVGPIGISPPFNAKIAASVAGTTDSSIVAAYLAVYAFSNLDGSGTPLATLVLDVKGNPSAFKVRFGSMNLPNNTKSIQARLVANSGGYAKFDDVWVGVLH